MVYGGSLLLHAGLAVGTVLMPKPVTNTATAITLVEEKKKKDPPKPPPTPPPPPKAEDKPKPKQQPQQHAQQAKVVPEAKAAAPPPMPVDNAGIADLGSLGNFDGIAIPGTGPTAAAAAATTTRGPSAAPTATTHKVQQLEAPSQGASACSDPVVRPKSRTRILPKYTMQAR